MKIWAKTKEFSEGKFLVVRRDGSVPHWPHFVLGARDPIVPQVLRYYATLAEQNGYEESYCDSIAELADDFEAYRADQGNGDPEAAPHRKDDPAVIAAMRGLDMTIKVRRDTENKPK